jgi:hypothetical protein
MASNCATDGDIFVITCEGGDMRSFSIHERATHAILAKRQRQSRERHGCHQNPPNRYDSTLLWCLFEDLLDAFDGIAGDFVYRLVVQYM